VSISNHTGKVIDSWRVSEPIPNEVLYRLKKWNDGRATNRAAYLAKAIRTPDFQSGRILARGAFQFAQLWLKR
jgi:hypothetical protein